MLNDYTLEMKKYKNSNSYATITKQENSVVPVAIFEISNNDEIELDIYEGVADNLYFKDYINIKYNDNVISALVYIMNLEAVKGVPYNDYIKTIEEGYIEHKFDINILSKALK